MTIEPLPTAVRPDRLTAVLRRAGALRSGQISNVEVVHSRSTVLSRIVRLRLVYDGDASGAPSALIFKTGLPERIGNENWDAGRQEVAFYGDVASKMSALVPRCFEATWAERKEYYLGAVEEGADGELSLRDGRTRLMVMSILLDRIRDAVAGRRLSSVGTPVVRGRAAVLHMARRR